MYTPQLSRERSSDASGHGSWEAYSGSLEAIYRAAAEWKQLLEGVEKPWLCWNVSPRWCVLQQRLVKEVGWTPVVGYDPRSGPPPVEPGGHLIDFNKHFQFPSMWFMFPLEFAFLFVPRLAFWHSDLLCRRENMERLARAYESLKDGEMAAILDTGGRRFMFSPRRHRFWELTGCTTKGASRDQFEKGTGWWRPFSLHPNCPNPAERARRARLHWDHGFGIMYWKRRYGGRVVSVALKPFLEGHCTSINRPDYKRVGPEGPSRNQGREIDLNYNLEEVAGRLGIAHLLPR
jgi:hypothetical protein